MSKTPKPDVMDQEIWCKADPQDGACFWEKCPLDGKTLAEKQKGCPLKTQPWP
jgi:hypothetical protein